MQPNLAFAETTDAGAFPDAEVNVDYDATTSTKTVSTTLTGQDDVDAASHSGVAASESVIIARKESSSLDPSPSLSSSVVSPTVLAVESDETLTTASRGEAGSVAFSSVDDATLTSPVSAHGPTPVMALGLDQQHVGRGLADAVAPFAHSGNAPEIVASTPALSPMPSTLASPYVLSQSFPMPILSTTVAATSDGPSSSSVIVSPSANSVASLLTATTTSASISPTSCFPANSMQTLTCSSSYVKSEVSSPTTSCVPLIVSAASPIATSPTSTNRFQRGRFSVLPVSEETASAAAAVSPIKEAAATGQEPRVHQPQPHQGHHPPEPIRQQPQSPRLKNNNQQTSTTDG